MYVVKRAFRNFGQMMVPGSVVEPGAIKRFRSLLSDGHIVEVTEQNFSKWDEYFRVRVGTAIKLIDETPDDTPDETPDASVAATPKVVVKTK